MAFTLVPILLLLICAVPDTGNGECVRRSKPDVERFAKCYLVSLNEESRNYFREAQKCSGITYTQYFYENQCPGEESPAVMKFLDCMKKNPNTPDLIHDEKKLQACYNTEG